MFVLAIYSSKFKNTERLGAVAHALVSVLRRQRQAPGQSGLKSVNLSQNKTVTRTNIPGFKSLYLAGLIGTM